MDKSVVINLIGVESNQNSELIFEETETSKKVFAEKDSVSANEWFEGGRRGLNPQYRFKVFFGDYSGEQIVEYAGERYSVYRTYEPGNDKIELYVGRKQGNVGSQD